LTEKEQGMTQQVFVYGTLLTGEYNNYWLNTAEKVCDQVIEGFWMVNLGSFPACIPVENDKGTILGEVWKVDDKTFARLDRLEGYPHFYDRKEVETSAGKAWIYCITDDKMNGVQVITSGSWKQFLKERTEE
jgi:gamma-glutamylcyclotransferase (GGCT)/AIG2-like uncharacterized protein YtfP